jgi:CheY-like chemotaxis protein
MLSHSVAHDLNNLLGSISVQISCAPHGGSGYADAAQKGCFAAASLLGQLTGYGRERSPRRECCSLEGIVEEALTLSTAGTQLEREVSVQSDLPGVEVDRHQMLQVFMNVLINARQAQPEGGRIRVAIGTASAPEQCSSPPPLVEVRIEDEGPGIPAEILPHIFESFYTTRRGGTGLGLAIAQSIVHRHEGTIELSSAGGAGTTCIVRLPACPERPGEGVGERAPHVFRGARIIVMDDNELIREALAATLEDMGLQVLQAGEGGEAIELYLRARAEGHPVDALIVDLTVSGGAGGARMMARLRQIDPRARVIVTSGYHYDEVMLNPREHGFAGALRKPFTQEALGRLLADILAMDSGEACLRP